MTLHEKKSESKNKIGWKKVTAVAAIGGAAVFGVGACSNENTSPSATIATSNSPEAPHMKGDQNGDDILSKEELHAMDPYDVANVAPSILADAYTSDFDNWRQDTYNILVKNNGLTSDQLSVVSVPTGPKTDYTDQQVMNQVTLDITDANIQEIPADGQRMLPLVFNRDSGGFNEAMTLTASQETTVMNAYRQISDSIPHPKESFNGVDLSDYVQSRVVRRVLLPNNENAMGIEEIALFGLVQGKSGAQEWQLVRHWLGDDSSANLALDKLTAPGNW